MRAIRAERMPHSACCSMQLDCDEDVQSMCIECKHQVLEVAALERPV